MSIRVHFTNASQLNLSVFSAADEIDDLYLGDTAEPPTDLRLVLEDDGNCEALVLDGTQHDLLMLGAQIINAATAATRRTP